MPKMWEDPIMSTPKRRGRPVLANAEHAYGRAENFRENLEHVWGRLWPVLARAKNQEEVKLAFREYARPYDNDLEPLAALTFQVLREPTFPKRSKSQQRFLADSLGAFGVVTPRRSRDICA